MTNLNSLLSHIPITNRTYATLGYREHGLTTTLQQEHDLDCIRILLWWVFREYHPLHINAWFYGWKQTKEQFDRLRSEEIREWTRLFLLDTYLR